MLKINPDPTFKAPVDIFIPGQKAPVPVTFVFRYRDADQLKELIDKQLPGIEALTEILVGWEGIDVDFSPDNLLILTKKYPGIDMPIYRKYLFELQQARLGN